MAVAHLTTTRDVLDRLYAAGQVRTQRDPIPIHPTGLSEPSGRALRELVETEAPARTIETGFGLGLSALWIIDGASAGGRLVSHTGVDRFQHTQWASAGRCTIEDAGVADMVDLIEQDSTLALPGLVSEGRRFDFAFIDGGHHFETVLCDLVMCARLVRGGSLIVVDDAWMPAVRSAVSYATMNLGLNVESHADEAARRFSILRTPTDPIERTWDHFEPFSVV